MSALAKAIRARADGMTEPDEVSHFDHQTAELLYALARLLEGKRRDRAFGAPGDWGYGTPIGDALLADLQAPLPPATGEKRPPFQDALREALQSVVEHDGPLVRAHPLRDVLGLVALGFEAAWRGLTEEAQDPHAVQQLVKQMMNDQALATPTTTSTDSNDAKS